MAKAQSYDGLGILRKAQCEEIEKRTHFKKKKRKTVKVHFPSRKMGRIKSLEWPII